MKATVGGSFPRKALQKWCFSNYRTAQGACAAPKSTYLSGNNLLQCGTKKGVAFPRVRAHSEFTAIKFSIFFWFLFLRLVLARFLTREQLEAFYEFDDQRSPSGSYTGPA
jgi:hypothetical protein